MNQSTKIKLNKEKHNLQKQIKKRDLINYQTITYFLPPLDSVSSFYKKLRGKK